MRKPNKSKQKIKRGDYSSNIASGSSLQELPSLCIFCPQEDLEISNLDEQLGDYACEDSSFPLPVKGNYLHVHISSNFIMTS